MTVTTAQATTLLETVLFESSTLAQANTAEWVALSKLTPATGTIAGLAAEMTAAPEAGIAQQVVRYYEGALGRVPGAVEVAYYVHIAESGLSGDQISGGASAVPTATWNQIAGYFSASPEYQSLTAGGNVILAFYENILGRVPSSDEVSFYQKALDGGTSVTALLQYFVNSPEYQTKTSSTNATLLENYGEQAVANMGGASPVALGDSAASVVTVKVANPTVSTITVPSSTGANDIVIDNTIASLTLNNAKTAVTLDFSHLSGTSAVTASLPAGSEAFSYDGVTVHIVNSAQPVELIGVSASQITTFL